MSCERGLTAARQDLFLSISLSKRNKHRRQIRAVIAHLTPDTYLVIDARGGKYPISPMGFALYKASHAIEPIKNNEGKETPAARVRPGYGVHRIGGETVIQANARSNLERGPRSNNFMNLLMRCFIYNLRGGRTTFAEMMRAIAEDHQEPSYPIVERWRGVLA